MSRLQTCYQHCLLASSRSQSLLFGLRDTSLKEFRTKLNHVFLQQKAINFLKTIQLQPNTQSKTFCQHYLCVSGYANCKTFNDLFKAISSSLNKRWIVCAVDDTLSYTRNACDATMVQINQYMMEMGCYYKTYYLILIDTKLLHVLCW